MRLIIIKLELSSHVSLCSAHWGDDIVLASLASVHDALHSHLIHVGDSLAPGMWSIKKSPDWHLGLLLPGDVIHSTSDNDCVVSWIRSFRSKAPLALDLLKLLVLACIRCDVSMRSNHIPGEINHLCDYGSRFEHLQAFHELLDACNLTSQIREMPPQVRRLWVLLRSGVWLPVTSRPVSLVLLLCTSRARCDRSWTTKWLPFFLNICITGFMGLPVVPSHGCLPYPLGPADQYRNAVCLVSYVKHLLNLGIAYSSIYTHHLPALALFHTCSVYHDPTTHPVVKMVTARLRDAHARKPSKRKLPAVPSMIRRSWHISTEGLPQLMEATAATLAFFLMLRSCEYSSKSQSTFDPKYQSVRKDVEFVSHSDALFTFNSIFDARRHPVHGYVFKLADGEYHPASAFLKYAKITIHGSKIGGSSDWTRSVSPSGHELCALSILLFFYYS